MRGGGKKRPSRPNFTQFKQAWENYKNLIIKFNEDQAMQRLDSIGPDFEEYFNVNGVDDDEGDAMNATSLSQAMAIDSSRANSSGMGMERRPSNTTPN